MPDNDFQLRSAGPDDLDAMYHLFAQVQAIHASEEPEFFRPPVKDEAFSRYFEGLLEDESQHLVLACIDGEAVGFVQYFVGEVGQTAFQRARRLAYIHGLVVAEDHRRAGYGLRLIEHVKREAKRQGVAQLGIDFWSFNDAARGCFRKAGFKIRRETLWLGP